jgi:predicted ArsR family transcriptional regulator
VSATSEQVAMSPVRAVDQVLIDSLRQHEGLSVTELMEQLGVTATAVRQRIERLIESGLIVRRKQSVGRGRPTFRYFLTDKGWRQAGVTYADLAQALWRELAQVQDVQLRDHILNRVSRRMGQRLAGELDAGLTSGSVDGRSVRDKLAAVVDLLADRKVPAQVIQQKGLPVLEVEACPYPDLVACDGDRAICDLETQMLSEAVGSRLELSSCRLDGHGNCQFRPVEGAG